MKRQFIFVGPLTSYVGTGSDGIQLYGDVRLKGKALADILAPYICNGSNKDIACTARVTIKIETLDVESGEVGADDQP